MLNIRATGSNKKRASVPPAEEQHPDGFYERVFKFNPDQPRGKTTEGTNAGSFAPGSGGTDSGSGKKGSYRPDGSKKTYQSHAEVARDYPKADEGRTMLDQTPEEVAKAAREDRTPDGLDTRSQFTTEVQYDENGKERSRTLTDERAALDNHIKNDIVGDHGVPENPVAYITGGGGASGKGGIIKMLEKENILPRDRVHVDVDKIRIRLPEWEAEMAQAAAEGRDPHNLISTFTHEESSDIAKVALAEGVAKGNHVMLDSTADSGIDKFEAKIMAMSENGKRPVIANYATVDYDEAYKRMRARGDEKGTDDSGRYVPAKYLRTIHAAVSNTFQDAVKRDLFTEYTLWDTTVPVGTKPIKVVSGGKGKPMVIHNQQKWDEFVARGKGIDPRPGEI